MQFAQQERGADKCGACDRAKVAQVEFGPGGTVVNAMQDVGAIVIDVRRLARRYPSPAGFVADLVDQLTELLEDMSRLENAEVVEE